jgi:UDP-galactopyranose mutase
MPINLHTINQFFRKTLNPVEAKAFINSLGRRDIENPRNFEEQALKFIGEDCIKLFFMAIQKNNGVVNQQSFQQQF